MFCLGIYTWLLTPIIWYMNPDRYENAKIKLFERRGLFVMFLSKSHTIILSIMLSYYGYLNIALKYFWLSFSIFYSIVFFVTIMMLSLSKTLEYDNQNMLGIKFNKDNSIHIKRMKLNKSINFVYTIFWIYSWAKA